MRKLFVISLSTFSALSYGYSSERAVANLSSDYATCAAYYLFMAKGLEASGSDSSQLNDLGAMAFEGAVMFSNEEVSKSRVKLSYKQLIEETDSDYSNSAILIDKYGSTCKSVLEDPEARLNYWLEKN
ncbi:TPA: hypothetical protein ACVOYJ_004013 [Vibrio diabolicus]|nr:MULTISPECIES: hypothetical protein [Vibrio harveyi group]MCR9938244.1 hypothetical protein [Vibrio antiquarius]